MKRAQISTEILVLVGLMLALLLPLLFYSYNRAETAKQDLSVQKAEFAATRLASLADSVGRIGGSSAIIEEIEIPPYIRGVSVPTGTHDIVVEVFSNGRTTQIVKSSDFELFGSGLGNITTGGMYTIEVSSQSDPVLQTQKVRIMLR